MTRRVVLVAIDIPAQPILLAIDLRLLTVREMAAILTAITANLVVEPGFLALQIGGLARS